VVRYEEKRQDYISFIRRAIRNLKRLAETFDDETDNGIAIRHLSDDSQKLSRRCDCSLIQAALIIPEHSSQLNRCLEYLAIWLDYDKSYIEYVQNDMKLVEREKKRLSQAKNSAEMLYNQLIYRVQLFKQSMDGQEKELKDMLKRMGSSLLEDYDEFDGSFVSSVNKKPQNDFHYEHLDCANMLEAVCLDLGELEIEIMKQNRLVSNSKTKMSLVEEKFKNLVYSKAALNKINSQLYSMYQEKCIKQIEIDILENSYLKLKEIYMCKLNSDTVEKIYYNMDLPTFKIGQDNRAEPKLPFSDSVQGIFAASKRSGTLVYR
jgi:hypothetical protein